MEIKLFKKLVSTESYSTYYNIMVDMIFNYLIEKGNPRRGGCIGGYEVEAECYNNTMAFVLKLTDGTELIRVEEKMLMNYENMEISTTAAREWAPAMAELIEKCWNVFIGRIAQEELEFENV